MTEENGLYTFTVATNERGDWDNRPIVELLPYRIGDIEIVDGRRYAPVIMDNFILIRMRDELLPMKGNRGEQIPIRGDYEAGQIFKVTFRARRLKGQSL